MEKCATAEKKEASFFAQTVGAATFFVFKKGKTKHYN
jgi:hypothetical protein